MKIKKIVKQINERNIISKINLDKLMKENNLEYVGESICPYEERVKVICYQRNKNFIYVTLYPIKSSSTQTLYVPKAKKENYN